MSKITDREVPYSQDPEYMLKIKRQTDQILLTLEKQKLGITSRDYNFQLSMEFASYSDEGAKHFRESFEYLNRNHTGLDAFKNGRYALVVGVSNARWKRSLNLWAFDESTISEIESGVETVVRDLGGFDERIVMIGGCKPRNVCPDPVSFRRRKIDWKD